MRRLGQGLAVAAMVALLPAADCSFATTTTEDCWDGLAVGDVVELELVAPYTPDGPYTWVELIDPGLPSCEAQDGLAPGTHRFRVVGSGALGLGCTSYWVTPLEPLGDVDFSGEIRGFGAVISAQVGHCGGFWRMFALREPSQDRDPFGEEATPGQLPPLRVQRYISGDCDCFDEWVGEIRHVAGADAGAGGAE